VEIDAECRRGLRVIEEIPDIRPCKIEGYNGIGKTSAIRLLQLCTGEQPFQGNLAAWRSFREQLIRATVTVTGLRDGRKIEWKLDPSNWPADEVVPLDGKIGRIIVDEQEYQSAGMSRVKSLLKIYRLNTTETPANILSRQAIAAGSAVEGWYHTQGTDHIAALDNRLAAVIRQIAASSLDAARLSLFAAKEAEETAESSTTHSEDVRKRFQALSRAVELASRLDTVRGSSPQMREKIRELEERLKQIDDTREELSNEIEAAQVQRHIGQQAKEELEKARSLVDRYSASVRRTDAQIGQSAAVAGLTDPSQGRVADAVNQASEELNALINAEPMISQGPQLLTLINDLTRRLDDAISLDLADTALVEEGTSNPVLTVRQLRDALVLQANSLIERGRGTDAEQLGRQIAAVRRRLDALSTLEELLKSLERAEARLKNAEEKFADLTAELTQNPEDQLSELVQRRNELDKEGRVLQSRIDRIRTELDLLEDGSTEDALAAELNQICSELEVDPSRLRSALERQRVQLETVERESAVAQARQASAKRDLDSRISTVKETSGLLAEAEKFSWLRQAFPQVQELPGLDISNQLLELEKLEKILAAEKEAIASTASDTLAIGVALQYLGEQLRNPESHRERRTEKWTLAVRQWLANQAMRWFDDEIMRQALFDNGDDIQIDPVSLVVSWVADGRPFTRPLEMFSSGQQAFAFTRARAAQLERDVDQAENRLIALDEFGAFLDAERFSSLSEYLVQRQTRMPDDHIVVILPCSVRAQAVAARGTGQSKRDRELAERGYFAEALES
jgi:DNA repair exonuclease SbcCD ATPase subunit